MDKLSVGQRGIILNIFDEEEYIKPLVNLLNPDIDLGDLRNICQKFRKFIDNNELVVSENIIGKMCYGDAMLNVFLGRMENNIEEIISKYGIERNRQYEKNIAKAVSTKPKIELEGVNIKVFSKDPLPVLVLSNGQFISLNKGLLELRQYNGSIIRISKNTVMLDILNIKRGIINLLEEDYVVNFTGTSVEDNFIREWLVELNKEEIEV